MSIYATAFLGFAPIGPLLADRWPELSVRRTPSRRWQRSRWWRSAILYFRSAELRRLEDFSKQQTKAHSVDPTPCKQRWGSL